MGIFDFFSTPDPTKAALTQGDQTQPQTPQGPGQGILASITPEQGQMLMAMGQGLLSQRGAAGLGAGFGAANEVAANQAKLQAQKEQNDILNRIRQQNANSTATVAGARAEKLKKEIDSNNVKSVVPRGDDGALIVYADGTQEFVSTPEMQAAGLRMNNGKMERAQAVQQYKINNTPLSAGEQRELREIDSGLNTADERLNSIKQARTAINDPKINDTVRQGARALPGGQAVAEFFGMDEANANRLLESVQVDSWLVKSALLKGAISDAEGTRLNKPMPTSFADKKSLNAWLDEREKDLQALRTGLQKIKETDYRTNPNANPVDPSTGKAPVGRQNSGINGLSPKAQSYFVD